MCLDNPDEIIAELQRLRDARAEKDRWPPPKAVGDEGCWYALDVTASEGARLLQQRIDDAEASIKQLGFTGKVVRVSEGDNARIMNQV